MIRMIHLVIMLLDDKSRRAGIGAWWETTSHLRNARAYNQAWTRFFQGTPTRQGALDFGRQLMQQYGLPVGF
ncbi:MAG: hypothetical protein AAF519_17425 [Bacteroidota bacterium]